jgi:hypothetical protein
MTDFFTKKQKKYWCEICRVFIEYNRITIEHHKNTSQHIHNMKRGTKYQKVKREYKNYVQDLKDKDQFTNDDNFLGKKTFLHQKNDNTAMFNKIKMEMMQKEINKEKEQKNSWQIFYDKNYQNIFFYNSNTGISQWEKPDDYKITQEEIQKIIEEYNKKYEIEKEKNEQGNAGKWVKIDKKTANKIFGKRKDDYYEKLEKMTKQNSEK